MTTVSLKQLLAFVAQALRRSRLVARVGRRLLPRGVLVEFRCARRIHAVARRLHGMQGKIAALSGHLQAGRIEGPVDADRNLRRMLAELKDDLNSIRRDLALWHAKECGGRTGATLAEAIAQLNRIAADTYAAADRLGMEIDDHDGRFA